MFPVVRQLSVRPKMPRARGLLSRPWCCTCPPTLRPSIPLSRKTPSPAIMTLPATARSYPPRSERRSWNPFDLSTLQSSDQRRPCLSSPVTPRATIWSSKRSRLHLAVKRRAWNQFGSTNQVFIWKFKIFGKSIWSLYGTTLSFPPLMKIMDCSYGYNIYVLWMLHNYIFSCQAL